MPARPSASKKAAPARSDSGAAPIPSRRSSTSFHRPRTASGSGGTSRSSGQRASASPTRIPGATPNASAGADTSPTSCSRPASGARAAGSAISARLSPRAANSGKRWMRTHTTMYEHMFA